MKNIKLLPILLLCFSTLSLSLSVLADESESVADIETKKSISSSENRHKQINKEIHAQQNNSALQTTKLQSNDISSSIIQVTIGLFIVLIVIAGSAWLARRFSHLQSSTRGQLKIVGGLHMGSRERVVLVQVGDEQLLLGVAPGRVQTLHVLDKPLDIETGGSVQVSPFAQKLQSLLSKK